MVVKRNPEQTRQRILEAAFEEVYRNGFRSASLQRILADTGLTKGALYHHFPNKDALGHAIIDEVLRQHLWARWVEPVLHDKDPISGLQSALKLSPDIAGCWPSHQNSPTQSKEVLTVEILR